MTYRRKLVRKRTRVVSNYRFMIRAISPTTGAVLTYNKAGKFSDKGPFFVKPTFAQAQYKMKRILAEHPEAAKLGLHVESIVPPKRKNPSAYSKSRDAMLAEMDKAADDYQAFSGRVPTHETRFNIADGSKHKRAGFALGRLVAVTYRPERDGDPAGTLYEHSFKKSSQPLLVASDDGSRLEVLGGVFQVTERGIEDR